MTTPVRPPSQVDHQGPAREQQRSKTVGHFLQWGGLALGTIGAVPVWFSVDSAMARVVATLISGTLVALIWRISDNWRKHKLDRPLTIMMAGFAALTLLTLFVVVNAGNAERARLRDQVEQLRAEKSPLESSQKDSEVSGSDQATSTPQDGNSSPTPATSGPAGTSPDGINLTQLQPLSGSLESGSAKMNNREYQGVLLANDGCIDDTSQTYVIERNKYRRFHAVVGSADDSREAVPLTFQILGNDRVLTTVAVGAAAVPKSIDVSIKDVLRLELRVSEDGFGSACYVTAVWAEARLER